MFVDTKTINNRQKTVAFGVFFTDNMFDTLTLSRAGFFGAPAGRGGGHKVPPLVKTWFPFSESTQVKFSESLSKIESCEANLVSMETMVMVLRWFIVFRFLTRNHHSKIKNLVPLNKSKKK